MRKVYLHGSLAKHGEVFELEVDTAAEAVAALLSNFPDLIVELRNHTWLLFRGDPETGLCLDDEMISGMRLGEADLHIMPEVMGSKRSSGALKAIAGVALIAATGGSATFLMQPILAGSASGVTWGNVMGQVGVAMALTGVSSMLAPETETQSEDSNKSFTMTGPTSEYGQGHAIQIVYGGPVITGGMLISGGIDADGLKSLKEGPVETPDPDVVAANPENVGGGDR